MSKAIATTVTATIIGYAFLGGGSHKANITKAIQTAYDMCGRELRQVRRLQGRRVEALRAKAVTPLFGMA